MAITFGSCVGVRYRATGPGVEPTPTRDPLPISNQVRRGLQAACEVGGAHPPTVGIAMIRPTLEACVA